MVLCFSRTLVQRWSPYGLVVKHNTMATKLYVGNLSYDTNDDSLQAHFAQAGSVESASVVTDRESGRSRGFGFVEMASEDEAQKAVSDLDGKELDGRALKVNEARPRE